MHIIAIMAKMLRHVATEPADLKEKSTIDSLTRSHQKLGPNVRGSDSVSHYNLGFCNRDLQASFRKCHCFLSLFHFVNKDFLRDFHFKIIAQ